MKYTTLARLLFIAMTALLAACSADEADVQQPRGLRLTTSVNDFDGDDDGLLTRTDFAGTAFNEGDWMQLKIICPYSSHTEFCETTYGNTYDAMWLFKWQGADWTALTPDDKVDVGGNYKFTSSYDLLGRYEAQQTPYVYTASTWNENVIFLANGTRYSQYSYIFEADQTTLRNYVKSDLLWAQTYMQTGSYNVHLAFNHVMACLKISVAGEALSDKAVVTVEGMPDIDQSEVVVGNYYAARSKVNSGYGYQQKHCCTKANNGKVLGVVYINEASGIAQVHPMSGNPVNEPTTVDFNDSFKTHPGNQFTEVPNTGVYTAYRDGESYDFYLIVPPCTLPAGKGIVWIRDGTRRYSYELTNKTLEQGKRYTINITLP